jgi:putative heme-binding domain-containing protein
VINRNTPFWAVLLLTVPLYAQYGRYLNDSHNPAIGNAESIAAGGKLYATSCAACHAPDGGGGRGPNLVRRSALHPLGDEAIFNTIRNGVPGADMPPTKLSDDQTWNLVAFIHALTRPVSENNVPGDPSAGERVFWDSKAGCSNCHAIRGRGSRMGPDLSNIGGSWPLALIKEAILDPTKNLTLVGKEGVSITMKSGDIIKGIARNRSNYSLQVVDPEGNLHLISMTDVKELAILDHSPMPSNYGMRLSPEELRDLLSYLARQSIRGSEVTSVGASDPQ